MPIRLMGRSSFASLALVVLFTLSITGCGGDSSTGPDNDGADLGSFEVTYNGDASGSISGAAFFREAQTEIAGQSLMTFIVFGVDIKQLEEGFFNGFGVGRRSRQPEPGTYDVQDSETNSLPPEGQFVVAIDEETKRLEVTATDGSVTIQQSNSERVKGSFEATLTGFMSGTEVTVSASGSFDAVPCEDNVENCPPETPLPPALSNED